MRAKERAVRRDQAESPEGATGAVWPARVTIALAAIALVAGGVFQASQTQKPWWYVAIAIGYGVGVGLPAFWIAFTKGHPLPRDRDSVTPATVVVGVLCAVVALAAVGWHRAHQRDDARHKAEQAERTGLRRAALREIEAFVSSRPGVWGGPPDYASSVPGISADLLTHMPLRTDASTSGEPLDVHHVVIDGARLDGVISVFGVICKQSAVPQDAVAKILGLVTMYRLASLGGHDEEITVLAGPPKRERAPPERGVVVIVAGTVVATGSREPRSAVTEALTAMMFTGASAVRASPQTIGARRLKLPVGAACHDA